MRKKQMKTINIFLFIGFLFFYNRNNIFRSRKRDFDFR